jgi:hypothetical protein
MTRSLYHLKLNIVFKENLKNKGESIITEKWKLRNKKLDFYERIDAKIIQHKQTVSLGTKPISLT